MAAGGAAAAAQRSGAGRGPHRAHSRGRQGQWRDAFDQPRWGQCPGCFPTTGQSQQGAAVLPWSNAKCRAVSCLGLQLVWDWWLFRSRALLSTCSTC